MIDEVSHMDRGRRLSRRRMARVSFGLLIVLALSIVSLLLFSPERAEIATAIETSSSVLIVLFTCFVSIVLGYLGLSMTESVMTKSRLPAKIAARIADKMSEEDK